MSNKPDKFLDLEMPEVFDLEVPSGNSPTGWIVDVGSLTPDLFERLDDGSYLCAGYGGRPLYLRVVELLEGGVIRCVDEAGAAFRYRVSGIAV